MNFENCRPEGYLKKLIDDVIREQNLKPTRYELLVKDVLEFKLYPNWIGKSTVIIPKYLNVKELDELKSSYINELLKKEYNVEIKDKDQWFTEEGRKIISSFLLTDQAKKYLLSKYLNESKMEGMLFSYYSLLVCVLYAPFALVKLKNEIFQLASKGVQKLKDKKPYQTGRSWLPSFRNFILKYQNGILTSFIFSFLSFGAIIYYAIGLKNSRDSDASTLSRGLANATTIKSKLTLIDFNYFSGGEEAYRKLIDRNKSLTKLFFKDQQPLEKYYKGIPFERYFKGIPFDENGDEVKFFSNEVSLSSCYSNLNDWEKNSSM